MSVAFFGPAAAQTPYFDARSTTSPKGHLCLRRLVVGGATIWRTRRFFQQQNRAAFLKVRLLNAGLPTHVYPILLSQNPSTSIKRENHEC